MTPLRGACHWETKGRENWDRFIKNSPNDPSNPLQNVKT